jgi:hypothetical protein
MRTRAVAIASDRSNAVGAVELECTGDALVVSYKGVGAFQEGYAPAALTTGTRVDVPWSKVREASFEGERLFLHLDESVTPHCRMLLAHFAAGDPPDPREVRKQKLLVRLATAVATVVFGLLTAVTLARVSSETGALSAVLLGLFGAGLVLAFGMIAEKRIGLGGPESDAARMGLVADLAAHLPHLSVSAHPPPLDPAKQEQQEKQKELDFTASFQALLPRTTTAVVITMSAALLAAALTANWLSRTPPEVAEDERPHVRERALVPPSELESPKPLALAPAPAALPPPAPVKTQEPAAAAPPAPSDTIVLSGGCRCDRADSLLWRQGIPRVSIVLIERKQREHKGHPRLDLEVGVVNNWQQSLPEVSLFVQFYEKDPPPSKKKTPSAERPLYFEGPLAPGQAIKWHVEGRGDDFEITGPKEPMLDPTGADAAPTNLLADLLKAIHRPIRLHGAMMLAYVGDPRAKEGALGMREALREEEAPYIDRLTWTFGDVRSCSVEAEGQGATKTARTCVFNTAREPRQDLGLRFRALDRTFRHDTPVEAPPLVVAEHTYKLSGQLAPNQGSFATFAFDTSNPDGLVPEAYEAVVDRADALF